MGACCESQNSPVKDNNHHHPPSSSGPATDAPGYRRRFERAPSEFESSGPHVPPRSWRWEKHGQPTSQPVVPPSAAGSSDEGNNTTNKKDKEHPVFVDANLNGSKQFPTGAQSVNLHAPGGVVDGEYFSLRVSPALGHALTAAVRIAAQAEAMAEADVGSLLDVAPPPANRYGQTARFINNPPPSSSSSSSTAGGAAAATGRPSPLMPPEMMTLGASMREDDEGDGATMLPWPWSKPAVDDDVTPSANSNGRNNRTGSSPPSAELFSQDKIKHCYHAYTGEHPSADIGWSAYDLCVTADCDYAVRERSSAPAPSRAGRGFTSSSSTGILHHPASNKPLPAGRCIGGVGVAPRLANSLDQHSGCAATGSAHSLPTTKTPPTILRQSGTPALEQAWKFRLLEVYQQDEQTLQASNVAGGGRVPRSEETVVVARVAILVGQGKFCLSTDNVERNAAMDPGMQSDLIFGPRVESTNASPQSPSPGPAASFTRDAAASNSSNSSNSNNSSSCSESEKAKFASSPSVVTASATTSAAAWTTMGAASTTGHQYDAVEDELNVEGKPVGLESAHVIDNPAGQWLLHVSSMAHPFSDLHDSDAVVLLESVSHPGFFLTVDCANTNLRKYALPSMPSPAQWNFALTLRQRYSTPFGAGLDGDALRARVAALEHAALEEYCQATAETANADMQHGMSPTRILAGAPIVAPAKRPTRVLPVPLPPCPVAVRDATQSFRLMHLQRPTLPTGREEPGPWQLPWCGANPVTLSIPTSTFCIESCFMQLAPAASPPPAPGTVGGGGGGGGGGDGSPSSSSSPSASSTPQDVPALLPEPPASSPFGHKADLHSASLEEAASAFYIVPDVMWHVRIVCADHPSLALAATGENAALLRSWDSPSSGRGTPVGGGGGGGGGGLSFAPGSSSPDDKDSDKQEILEVAAMSSSALARAFSGIPHADTDAQLWRVMHDEAACPVRGETQQAVRSRMLERYSADPAAANGEEVDGDVIQNNTNGSGNKRSGSFDADDTAAESPETAPELSPSASHLQRLRRKSSQLIDFTSAITFVNKLFPGFCLALTNDSGRKNGNGTPAMLTDNNNNNNNKRKKKVRFILVPLSDTNYRRHVFVEPFAARRNAAALFNLSIPTRILSAGSREDFLQRWIRAALDANAVQEGFSSDALAINLPPQQPAASLPSSSSAAQQQQQQPYQRHRRLSSSGIGFDGSSSSSIPPASPGIPLPNDAISLGMVPLSRIGHSVVVRIVVFLSDGGNSHLTSNAAMPTRTFTPSASSAATAAPSAAAAQPISNDSLAGTVTPPAANLQQRLSPGAAAASTLLPQQQPAGAAAAAGSRPATGQSSSVFSRPQSSLSILSDNGGIVTGGGLGTSGGFYSSTGQHRIMGGVAGTIHGAGWILRWSPSEPASYDVDGDVAATPLLPAGAAAAATGAGTGKRMATSTKEAGVPSAGATQAQAQAPAQQQMDINNTFLLVPVGAFLQDARHNSAVKSISFLLLHLGSCGVQPVRRPLFLTWLSDISALTLAPWTGRTDQQMFEIDMTLG